MNNSDVAGRKADRGGLDPLCEGPRVESRGPICVVGGILHVLVVGVRGTPPTGKCIGVVGPDHNRYDVVITA